MVLALLEQPGSVHCCERVETQWSEAGIKRNELVRLVLEDGLDEFQRVGGGVLRGRPVRAQRVPRRMP